MADRVLSTSAAREAIKQMDGIIKGPLLDQVEALIRQGMILSEPNKWDGRLAEKFRDEWHESQRALSGMQQKLEELRVNIQQIHDNIWLAGSGTTPSPKPPGPIFVGPVLPPDPVIPPGPSPGVQEHVDLATELIGQHVDVDGSYGAQCVDLVKHARPDLVGKGLRGNGGQWAENARKLGIDTRAAPEQPSAGGVLVWPAWKGGATENGHVAIIESVNPDGTVNVIEQNWPPGTPVTRRTVSLVEGMEWIP